MHESCTVWQSSIRVHNKPTKFKIKPHSVLLLIWPYYSETAMNSDSLFYIDVDQVGASWFHCWGETNQNVFGCITQ